MCCFITFHQIFALLQVLADATRRPSCTRDRSQDFIFKFSNQCGTDFPTYNGTVKTAESFEMTLDHLLQIRNIS